MEKIQFVLSHYALLAIFASSCYGIGIFLTRLVKINDLPNAFTVALTLCVGVGIFILALQILSILGVLRPGSVLGLVVLGEAGLVVFCAKLFQERRRQLTMPSRHMTPTPWRWVNFAIPTIVITELFLRPLSPPQAWDELMYHLPHARNWALAGQLQVNEWLRYPLFPYNFNLLYAGGLMFENDIFSHMAHAFAGALVIIAMYGVITHYFGRAVASIAILLFVALVKVEFGNAYVDLALTAFIFFSAACTLLWYERRHFGLICIAAFLLGVAAGIKYQALIFVPFIALAIFWRERGPRKLFTLLLLFALPCAYWYIRNYLISGDPFHPLGGAIFGYWGWNPKDMEYQVADIRRVFGWPSWHVWPALGAFALWARRKEIAFRGVLFFSTYAFTVWMLTSHYPRYLMPAYPFLCILAALTLRDSFQHIVAGPLVRLSAVSSRAVMAAGHTALAIVLMALLLASTTSAVKQWHKIQANSHDRAAYLRETLQSYEVAEFLRTRPDYKLVQIGLESDLYYLPPDTIGDIFGPGRYRDFLALSPADLAAKIKSVGANALLLPTSETGSEIRNRNGFDQYFKLVLNTPGAQLYAVK